MCALEKLNIMCLNADRNCYTATLEDYLLREGDGVLYHPDANIQGH